MKLSEQLRELRDAAKRKNSNQDYERHHSTVPAVYEEAAQLAEAYEAEVEKRIAELKAALAAVEDFDLERRHNALLSEHSETKLALMNCQNDSAIAKHRLEKRVAELERTLHQKLQDIGVLTTGLQLSEARVSDLESQLAWTPVSAGLPTEPGVYEFYDLPRRFEGSMEVYELHADPLIWEDEEGEEWKPEEFWSCAATKTHYRRIELPEAS